MPKTDDLSGAATALILRFAIAFPLASAGEMWFNSPMSCHREAGAQGGESQWCPSGSVEKSSPVQLHLCPGAQMKKDVSAGPVHFSCDSLLQLCISQ